MTNQRPENSLRRALHNMGNFADRLADLAQLIQERDEARLGASRQKNKAKIARRGQRAMGSELHRLKAERDELREALFGREKQLRLLEHRIHICGPKSPYSEDECPGCDVRDSFTTPPPGEDKSITEAQTNLEQLIRFKVPHVHESVVGWCRCWLHPKEDER